MNISRRKLLLTGAALPLAAPMLSLWSRPAVAQEAVTPAGVSLFRSFAVGEIEVVALKAGGFPSDMPHSLFGTNVDQATFDAVSSENFIPANSTYLDVTPTLVRTATETILFDTGLDAPGLLAALSAAGVNASDVTRVVLTHLHPDHIGGLTDETGSATFPNAAFVAGQVEYDHWAKSGDELFEQKVRPFADRMTFLKGEDAVAPGITAIEAFGHTPGHLAFRMESGGQQMIAIADTANHYVWSLGHPDWEVMFDVDKAAAAATRRRLLDMIATDRLAVVGYHMPYPGVGFVETRGDGYHWVSASYQFG